MPLANSSSFRRTLPAALARTHEKSRASSSDGLRRCEAQEALLDEGLQGVERRRRQTSSAASRVQPPTKTEGGRRAAAPRGRGGRSDHSIVARSTSVGGDRRRGRPSGDRAGPRGPRGSARPRAPSSARRELDREGKIVQACAELGDLPGRLEPGALAEERDRLGVSERRHCVLEFALYAQQLARGDEERQVGTRRSERGELGSGLDHLLEVVEEERALALTDVLGEAVLGTERLQIVSVTRAGSRRAARPTQKTPSAKAEAWPPRARRARRSCRFLRVPVNVSRRTSSRARSSPTSCSSRSLPRKSSPEQAGSS